MAALPDQLSVPAVLQMLIVKVTTVYVTFTTQELTVLSTLAHAMLVVTGAVDLTTINATIARTSLRA